MTISLPTATTSGLNVAISAVNSDQFTIGGAANTGSVEFAAGALTKTVLVCSKNTTVPATYQFAVSLSGADSSKYTVSSPVSLVATAHTVTVAGGTLTVPKGGCSSVQTITLSQAPTTSLVLAFAQLDANGYYIRETATSNLTVLSASGSSMNFSVCSRSNATNSMVAAVTLSGSAASKYIINNGSGASFTLVTDTAPTQTISASDVVNIDGDSAAGSVDFTVNRHGYVYYTVRDAADPVSG